MTPEPFDWAFTDPPTPTYDTSIFICNERRWRFDGEAWLEISPDQTIP